MKNSSVLVALLLVLLGCARQDTEADKVSADASVKGFYAAFEKFDFAAMQTFCTPDFSAIEGETIFKSLNEYMSWAQSMKGNTFHAQMDIVKADLVENMAVILYRFDVSMKMDKEELNVKGYESHTLKKVDGKWLIAFYQCTYTDTPPKLEKGSFLGIHIYKDIVLKPGVTEAQVEDFLQNKYIPALNASSGDSKSILIKSLRGDNANKLGILMYFASEEARNTYFNQDGTVTQKGQDMFKKLEPIQAEMANLFTSKGDPYDDWLIK
jgi:hypothetical protein